MADIYAINIKDDITEIQIKHLLTIISEEKKQKIEKFRFKEDFLRSLYGDILARKLIANRIGIKSKNIKFYQNLNGKPYVFGKAGVYFNISHSKDWVVCVISKYECGIDIEKIKNIDMSIAERFFSKNEYKTLLYKKGKEQIELFYDLWTLKESYIKWKGKGFSIPLNSFEFIKKENSFNIVGPHNGKIFFKQFFIDDNYKLSVCMEENKCELHIINIMQFKY